MVGKMNHIGIIVRDLDQAIESYTKGLGLVLDRTIENPDLKLRIGILKKGPLEIELLEFGDPGLPIPRALRADKPGLSHICFEVSHLDEVIKELEAKGFKLVDGFPRQGAHGRVAFVIPPHEPLERLELFEVE